MKILPIFLIVLLTLLSQSEFVLAASKPAVDVADTFPIADTSAVDGDVLITSNQGLQRASGPYDPRLFGILQKDTLVVYRTTGSTDQPVVRTGIAEVNVTDLNGTIKKGDFITSSGITGKGEKANQSGYVIGSALEDFPSSGTTTVSYLGHNQNEAQVRVAMRIEYAEINSSQSLSHFLDFFNAALFKNLQNPDQFTQIIRYFLAGLVALVCLVIAYLAFSRSMVKSLEALGRNPLARGPILFTLGINVLVILLIVGIGIVISIILLKI